MHDVHLGSVDLNLLVVLDALLAERNVTRAAARVGITQSAASHALGRLRVLLGDPLLVRGKTGMMATHRAEQLVASTRRALDEATRIFAPAAAFDPATAQARVTIATSDYAELVLLPRVVNRLARDAPGIDLRTLALEQDLGDALANGVADLALAPMPPSPATARPGLYARELFDERFVCVVRKQHPLAGKKLTLARFIAASHALISPRGTEGGLVDDALAKLGLRRRVAIAVPHFLIAPHLVAQTELVLTLAERIAQLLARPLGLATLEPPAELGLVGFTISAQWHARTHDDPARRWLRQVIVEEAAQI